MRSISRPNSRHAGSLPCATGIAALRLSHLMNPRTQTETKSRVVVVEDHPVLCDGLKQLIDSQLDLICVGVADDTSDAKRLAEECQPDLMVLDLRLKAGDALDFIKTLRA